MKRQNIHYPIHSAQSTVSVFNQLSQQKCVGNCKACIHIMQIPGAPNCWNCPCECRVDRSGRKFYWRCKSVGCRKYNGVGEHTVGYKKCTRWVHTYCKYLLVQALTDSELVAVNEYHASLGTDIHVRCYYLSLARVITTYKCYDFAVHSAEGRRGGHRHLKRHKC